MGGCGSRDGEADDDNNTDNDNNPQHQQQQQHNYNEEKKSNVVTIVEEPKQKNSAGGGGGGGVTMAEARESGSVSAHTSVELAVVRTEPIQDYYELAGEVGKGGYSVVYAATAKRTGEKFAVKCINKSIVNRGQNIKHLRREIGIMKNLDHPNVLKMVDVFEDDNAFYIVTELMQGKELFEKIVQRGCYSEKDAAIIFKQLVSGVAYLHGNGIAHRDLKPENLLTMADSPNEPEVIKIADFGFSKNYGESTLVTSCGSPNYVAPEILTEDHYNNSVDMWSAGVILYILLCGYPPFFARTQPELYQKIMALKYDFNDRIWAGISAEAKDMIRHLLVKDPKERLTAEQCLEHPWLNAAIHRDDSDPLVIDRLKEFNAERKASSFLTNQK